MPNPKFIQINVPEPCSQGWENMLPGGQGRFCTQCQKTVIDFTDWSDADLYAFFSKRRKTVCGRFRTSQTDRQISIPPQPHSQLYRMVIALGLTLVFTQGAYAQINAPLLPAIRISTSDSVKPTINPGVVTTDSITSPVAKNTRPEIYTMGAIPPNIAVIPKVWVTNTVYMFTKPLDGKVPLPKQIKGIAIPKLRKP